VFEIALDASELDRWQSDLEKIGSLASDARRWPSWRAPAGPGRQGEDAVRNTGRRRPLAMNLVHLLMARGRLDMAVDIVDGYRRLLTPIAASSTGRSPRRSPLTTPRKQSWASS